MFSKIEKDFNLTKPEDRKEILWNEPVIDIAGEYIKNKIPKLWKGVSAYVIKNGKLYYLEEDDSYFKTLTRIHNIEQLRILRARLVDFKESRKNNNTVMLLDDGTIIFSISTVLRNLDISWIEDEIYLLNKIIKKYDMEY